MDGSKKRRVYGAAAFSATAIASLLGAQPATAEPPAQPPASPGPARRDRPPTARLHGLSCDTSETGVYQWWLKVE